MFPKSKNDDWGGQKELHVIGKIPGVTKMLYLVDILFTRSFYKPCLREAVEGDLIHPFEVVHIKQIGPPWSNI